ncbi:MAG: DUF1697 domain-containing protein [Alphaproteobacteria bacterium]|nr:DUF1697 domain-containing protein [Alphaproteobacteria bacterium]MBL6936284.1 DUF1697 domain-containing protein [Alphaproteobacteria bacterium]MBL7098665.1 DUF1697 domain-containing protein [Alphaproteobacteria bacterium]
MIQVGLLRAVNVGGNAKVPMADLRAMAEKIGLKNARTLLASGNLVFDAGARTPAASEKLLESACAKTFGLKTDIYVRSHAELKTIIARNPFEKEAEDDPSHLVVLFMRDAPGAKAFGALQNWIKGSEQVRGDGNHAYIVYPDGIGMSKLTPGVIERHLGCAGTARNWNTVGKLAALSVG